MSGGQVIKRIGFGAAKITKSFEHEAALMAALKAGITVFDTAPNYGHDGASERAIASVLSRESRPSGLDRENLILATKFGYYSDTKPGPESVPIGDESSGLFYSMHPKIMERELKASLQRLNQDYVDVLYVHNPEHYLADILLREEQNPGTKSDAKDQLLKEERIKLKDRLVRIFEALEDMKSQGKIRQYGVSSNGLALNPKEDLHLSLNTILDAAAEAAKKAGKLVPSLGTIQLPLNILEPSGLVTAAHARSKGLDVVVNRPFTAVAQGGLYRLVDLAARETPPEGYMEACREALDYFNPQSLSQKSEGELTEEEKDTLEGCRIVQDIIREMNKGLLSFTSVEAYSQELERRIIPLIGSTFEALDEEAADRLQSFFQHYGELVRYNAARQVHQVCQRAGHDLEASKLPLHEYALNWLLEKIPNQISTVLVGMPQENFVYDIARIANQFEKKHPQKF